MAEFDDSETAVDHTSMEGPSVFHTESSGENSRIFRHHSGDRASGNFAGGNPPGERNGAKSPRGEKSPSKKGRKNPSRVAAETAYREQAAEASDESSDVDDAVPSCSGNSAGGNSFGGRRLEIPRCAETKSVRRKHIAVTSDENSDDDYDGQLSSRQGRRQAVRSEVYVPPARRTGGS